MTDAAKVQAVRVGRQARLTIGRTPSGAVFRVPAEFVTLTMGIVGIRGSGKTTAAKVFVEEMLACGFQVVIIDPVNVWWGLRSSADGKGDGFPVVILGDPAEQQQADLPLEPNAGKVVADFVVDRGASVVLSLGHMSKTNQKQFVAEFAERLYRQKGRAQHRTPLHLVIDEADSFAPQRVMANIARCFGAVDDLVRRGRAKGIGVTLISQRPATVNKDVLTQVESLLMLRMLSPQDRKAVQAWVEVHDVAGVGDRVMGSLHKLKCGQAWVWSPAWLEVLELVNIRPPKTFDSSATPKVGQIARAPRKVAKVDLETLSKEIRDTIERAQASDPAALKRRVAQLERDLRKAESAPPQADRPSPVRAAEPKTVIEKVPVLTGGDRNCLKDIRALLKEAPRQFQVILEQLDHSLGQFESLGQARAPSSKPSARPVAKKAPYGPVVPRPEAPPARGAARSAAGPSNPYGGDSDLSKAQGSILAVLARHGSSTKRKTALLAGYSPKGGGFNNAVCRCRVRGWLESGGDGGFAITEDGLATLGDYLPLPIGEELLDFWQSRLGKAEREIFEVLRMAWPDALTKEAIAERTASGYVSTGGGFNNAVSRLRTLELIDGRGELRLTDDFAEATT